MSKMRYREQQEKARKMREGYLPDFEYAYYRLLSELIDRNARIKKTLMDKEHSGLEALESDRRELYRKMDEVYLYSDTAVSLVDRIIQKQHNHALQETARADNPMNGVNYNIIRSRGIDETISEAYRTLKK